MVKNHISTLISEQLGHIPTNDQKILLDGLAEYIWDFSDPMANPDKIFMVKGYAGTGKTTVMSALVKSLPDLKLRSVLLAPTGRAAKVISGYAKKNASTIHKKIYRQKSQKDGIGVFALDKNLHKKTLFIVDEASMISNQSFENSIFGTGRLLDDLIEYVYSGENCKLILVGDTAQLPPVGLAISPALDKNVFDGMGFELVSHELTEVVRQKNESGILHNATLLRENIMNKQNGYPAFELEGFNDVRRISGADLIQEIDNCYHQFGMENTMIVCRSNKRANRFNEGIRRAILWREDELCMGDYLMIVKNNYFWLKDEGAEKKTDFIANGDIAEVTRIGRFTEVYGKRFADVSLRFMDYPDMEVDANIMMDTLDSEKASLSNEESNAFFYSVLEDYQHLKTKKARIQKVKENEFFNALQIKFSYAITCHKAQGGQWKAVFIDQGWLSDEMLNTEYLRWLYTAFTRPIERLYLVNFNKEFFPDEPEFD